MPARRDSTWPDVVSREGAVSTPFQGSVVRRGLRILLQSFRDVQARVTVTEAALLNLIRQALGSKGSR